MTCRRYRLERMTGRSLSGYALIKLSKPFPSGAKRKHRHELMYVVLPVGRGAPSAIHFLNASISASWLIGRSVLGSPFGRVPGME